MPLKEALQKALGEYRIPAGEMLLLRLCCGTGRKGPNLDAVRVLYSREAPLAQGLAEVVSSIMGTDRPPKIRRQEDPAGRTVFTIEHSSEDNPRAAGWLRQKQNLRTLAEGEAAMLAEYYGWQPREKRYERVRDLEESLQPAVEQLLDRGRLLCRGGKGRNRIIDLGEEELRLFLEQAGGSGEI